MIDDRTTSSPGGGSGDAPAARPWRLSGLLRLVATIGAIAFLAAGCEVMTAPPPQPIDGLRMTGHENPRAAGSSSSEKKSKQPDVR